MNKKITTVLSLLLATLLLATGCADSKDKKIVEKKVENEVVAENNEGIIEDEEEAVSAEDFELVLGDKAKISEEEIREIYSTDVNMLEFFNDFSGRKAPDFKMTDMEGNTISLSDFEGENIIVEFMGSWCDVCVSASKVNEKFNNEYEGAKIISVGLNETKEGLESFIEEAGLKNTEFYLPAEEDGLDSYNLFFVPIYFNIDKEGYVQMILAGDAPYDILVEYADRSFK